MMILRSTPPSPFGRKAVIAASVLGLSDQIKIEPADPTNPADTLRQQNPVGKIPILITEDGQSLFDSRVILEYLDHRAGGGKIIPTEPKARFATLGLQALADGTTDAQILVLYEGRFRPAERHEPKWVDYQQGKVERGLAALEAMSLQAMSLQAMALPPAGKMPDAGQIAVACMLGHRDLRFQGDWRKNHPKLVAWLDGFAAAVPAFNATKVTP